MKSQSLACTQPKCRASKGILEINDSDVIFRFECYHGNSFHWQGVSLRRTLQKALEVDGGFLDRFIGELNTMRGYAKGERPHISIE